MVAVVEAVGVEVIVHEEMTDGVVAEAVAVAEEMTMDEMITEIEEDEMNMAVVIVVADMEAAAAAEEVVVVDEEMVAQRVEGKI